MLEADRIEFNGILAELFAAIDKPLGEAQRGAFWKGLRQMSLVEFSRCRDKIVTDLADGEAPRKFGVSDVWVAKGKLRAAQPMQHADDGWRGDEWGSAANRHLLEHLKRVVSANPQIYGRGASYEAMRDPARLHDKTLDASPEFVRNVGILVRFKNLWADQMRLSADKDGVPIPEQQETWRECVRLADEEIANAAKT